MKKIFTLALGLLASATAANAACYLIGQANGQNWEANVGTEMTEVEDGVYTITADCQAYFGFATALGADAADWDGLNSNRLFPADDVQMITLVDGEAVIELTDVKGNNDSWTFGTEVTGVTFVVNLNDMELTVKTSGEVVVDENIYLKGDVNAWGVDPAWAMTKVSDTVYTLSNVSLYGGWKLANAGWAPVNVGSPMVETGEVDDEGNAIYVSVPLTPGEVYTGWNDGASKDIVINGNKEEVYNVAEIKLDLSGDAPTILVTLGDGGVANVSVANNVAPVYYNLQGVRVANPANGLYIVVRGNEVSKVVR